MKYTITTQSLGSRGTLHICTELSTGKEIGRRTSQSRKYSACVVVTRFKREEGLPAMEPHIDSWSGTEPLARKEAASIVSRSLRYKGNSGLPYREPITEIATLNHFD